VPRYLIIVAPDQPGLYDYLTRNFAGDEKVQVILDRRPGIEQNLRSRSVVIIRVED
jgi:hypothetical protein